MILSREKSRTFPLISYTSIIAKRKLHKNLLSKRKPRQSFTFKLPKHTKSTKRLRRPTK